MNQDIIKFAKKEFSFLITNYDFSEPIITYEKWCTRLDYIKNDTAIELELDWREMEAFLLVVKLQNGKLPHGYYISKQKLCRKHFLLYAKDQQLISEKQFNEIRQTLKPQDILGNIFQYKKILLKCLNQFSSEINF